MLLRFLVVALFLDAHLASGREWRSPAGGRTLDGAFVRLANGSVIIAPAGSQPPMAIKLDALSPGDQSFARSAQTALEEGLKLGPQAFEVTRCLSNGALCRFAMKMGNGSVLFTGAEFLLVGSPATLKQGERRKDLTLYPAGLRTFHPLQGSASPMKSFALSPEEAAASSGPADIYEPVVEIIEARGLGIAISDDGLVLVESGLIEGATAIDLDMGKDHSPGTIVTSDEDLGITILAGKGKLTPARLGPRKPITLGQPIFALSFPLGTTGKSIDEPTITSGIISKLGNSGKRPFFEHDATRDPTAIGGLVLSVKGDVLGLMTGTPSLKKPRARSASASDSPPPPVGALGTCLQSDRLAEFLKTVPKVTASRVAPTAGLAEAAVSIRPSMLIVKVIKEVVKEIKPPPATAAGSGQPGSTVQPTSAWSLSKSGTRHNSKCRFFDASKPCQATDGKPCKTCGG